MIQEILHQYDTNAQENTHNSSPFYILPLVIQPFPHLKRIRLLLSNYFCRIPECSGHMSRLLKWCGWLFQEQPSKPAGEAQKLLILLNF